MSNLGPETPDLQEKISAAVQDLMPSFVQAICAKLQEGNGEVPPGGETEEEPEPDEETIARGEEEPPEETGSDSPAPDDDEARKYKAMGPQHYEAYMAGCRKGGMKYSRREGGSPVNGNGNLAGIVARQSTKLKAQEDRIQALETTLSNERTAIDRYQRLGALSKEYTFDPKEELDLVQTMTNEQFDRHCDRVITKYQRREDVGGFELVDDGEPDRYSRGSNNQPRISAAVIDKYSREAANIASQKNFAKPGSTTFEAEFDALCKKNNITV